MFDQFKHFIISNKLLSKEDRILLAVSGGVDSAVMSYLFSKAGFSFGIAHCNFGLRGREADEDAAFVRKLSEKYGCPFYAEKFSTKQFAKENHLSIQAAARELRYRWFEKIRSENQFNRIAIAHHRDDSVETVLLNYIRGTGIAGLHGILPKSGRIVRPLLFATRKEIEEYAARNNIAFRIDKTNKDDYYARNLLRNRIIPLMKRINPSLDQALNLTAENLRAVEKIYRKHIRETWQDVSGANNGILYISIRKLLSLDPDTINTYLFEFLHPFGFNKETVDDILRSIHKQSGKKFFSPTHFLVKDRKYLMLDKITMNDNVLTNIHIPLLLTPKSLPPEEDLYNPPSGGMGVMKVRFSIVKSPAVTLSKIRNRKVQVNDRIAYLDMDKLDFPLTYRKWRPGDWFYPLGMERKKKLSDFLIDKKVSLIEKDKIFVLCSGKSITWVVGHRVDDRYKISGNTSRILVVELKR